MTTYSDLKAAIADFLLRDDLTASIPTFITLAEASINRDLRHWKMEKRSQATFTGRYSSVPDDWLATIRIGQDAEKPLQLISYHEISEMRRGGNGAGIPCYFAHVAGEFEVYPEPAEATTMELFYHAQIPALSDANPTNWLIQEGFDVYLYGSLVHTAPYLQEDARLAVWGGLYRDVIDKMGMRSTAARHSTSKLVRRG